MGSNVSSGFAPCPPFPLISIVKSSAAAIFGPGFVLKKPNGKPGALCNPYT